MINNQICHCRNECTSRISEIIAGNPFSRVVSCTIRQSNWLPRTLSWTNCSFNPICLWSYRTENLAQVPVPQEERSMPRARFTTAFRAFTPGNEDGAENSTICTRSKNGGCGCCTRNCWSIYHNNFSRSSIIPHPISAVAKPIVLCPHIAIYAVVKQCKIPMSAPGVQGSVRITPHMIPPRGSKQIAVCRQSQWSLIYKSFS